MWKVATKVGVASIAVCMAAAIALAKQPGKGGGAHPAHPSFHAAGGTHFNVRHAAPQFKHAAPSVSLRHARGLTTHAVRHAHVPAAAAGKLAIGKTNLHNFEARRHLVANEALQPFMHHGWHPHHHLGWVGPLFWPYAYGTFFYYALWPYDYYYFDPFWAYGYYDLFEGIFSPYSYEPYVQGRGAAARMTALKQSVAQACENEAAEVTGWPLDQIQEAVQPNDQQKALLDELGNAVVKASDAVKSQCPANISFTPTGRLADMHQRLQGMLAALDIVTPPLTRFYDSLSDEQKARFDQMGAPGGGERAQIRQTANAPNPQAECSGNVIAWPADKIEHAVQPTEAQRAKLEALQAAAAQAADIIKATCPSEQPRTPPGRLEAIGKRLRAMLQAVQTVQPPLQDLYNSLSDDQKARFNMLGREIVVSEQ